jgi:4-hydroxy-tetrahydrodipicolinate synthase
MRTNPFSGTGIALVTPFQSNGELDQPALVRLVNHCIAGGVEFLVALGTTGETATLTSEEKNRVLQTVAETTNGRVPLVVGVGGNNTRAVCDALQSGMPEGYSGVLSVSPYYNKPTQEGIYQHYKAVCGSTDAPVILYNVPGRTGSNVLAETTLRVAHDCPNAVAMKEASGNLEQAMAIVQGAPDGFEVLSGDDNLTLPLIASGATGVISVSGQAYPGLFSQMVRDARSGHLDRARTAHYALFRFTQLLFAEGNPGGIKAALAQLEVMENQLRLPLVPVSSSLQGELRKAMAELA